MMRDVAENLAKGSDQTLVSLVKHLMQDGGVSRLIETERLWEPVIRDLALATLTTELFMRAEKRKKAAGFCSQ
mgnify:FL=1